MNDYLESMFSVKGKTVLVTGGGKGIGQHMCEALVKAGARVYICSRDGGTCERTAASLSEYGECVGFEADISTLEGIATAAAWLSERETALHALINNAGRSWGAPLASFPEKGWDAVIDLNLKTPFFLVRDLLPLLEQAGTEEDPARIINISSIAGIISHSLSAYSYGSSKAGVSQLTRMLSRDLVDRHINVNAIAPGWFKSKMTAHLSADDETEAEHLKTIPMGRFGKPHEIGALALYMISPASAYMTGNIIPIDGGVTMAG